MLAALLHPAAEQASRSRAALTRTPMRAIAAGAGMVHFCAAMSAAPDPAELAPSRDPAAYGRRPLFTAGFFVWLSLCLVCLAAGGVAARFALFRASRPEAAKRPVPDAGPRPPAPRPGPAAAGRA